MSDQTTIDITALAAQLQRAWAPVPPPVQRDEDDDAWEGDGCGCGGRDEYWDRPICNCGDGCSCDQCHYYRHRQSQTCRWRSAPVPAGERCDKPTRYRIQGWYPDGETSVQAKYVDPSLEGDPRGEEFIPFDERTGETGFTYTACSQQHAYELAAELRSRYNDRQPDPAKRYRFKIEQYRYEPHDLDLPDILQQIRDLARSLSWNAGGLVQAGCRVPDVASSAFAPDHSLPGARRAVAKLVPLLAQLDTREKPAPRYRPGSPQPEHLNSVRGPDGAAYDRNFGTVWRAWNGDRQYPTWEAMLAELGEVSGWPRHELVLPGEPTASEADHG